jgi:hypothetical protein
MDKEQGLTCVSCGGTGHVTKGGKIAFCIRCGATMTIGVGQNKRTLHVEGQRWEEVRDVAAALAKRLDGQSEKRSPWATGSFYLFSLMSLIALLLVVAKVLSVWILPVIIAGGLILVTVVGALQLRHDSNLSQQNFLKLMTLAFRQLPLLGKLGRSKESPPDNSSGE